MSRSVTRRFNYTRRIEIPRSQVEIDLRLVEGVPVATVMRLSLPENVGHSPDEWGASRVVLEAWRTDISTYQRFDNIGTVTKVAAKTPVCVARLTEFPDDQNISFRIKLVSSASKRILAEADRLFAVQDDRHREELIRVIPKDLGELPWTVDWSDANEGPKIFVNSKIERNRELLTRDPVVSGLVVSAVLREVLYRAIATDDAQDAPWAKRWKDLGTRMTGTEAPSQASEDVDSWVSEVLHRFACAHSLSTLIEEHFRKHEVTA